MDILEQRILDKNIQYGLKMISENKSVWNAKRENWQHSATARSSALRGEIRNCNCGEGHQCDMSGNCGQ